MSIETTKGVVPRLRFPEFGGAGEWVEKPLGEMCEVLNNRRKPITASNRSKGEYPYYGASGIVDYVNNFLFDERLLLVGEDGAKWGAFEATAFIVTGKYWVNNHAHVLRPREISDTLLEQYLVKLDLSPYVTGAAPPKLTLGKLKDIPVPVPSTQEEQQKIAAALSSLDDLIAAEVEKGEALKAHKRGLMQALFPAEGESAPKVRFEGFEQEWQQEKFGSLIEIKGRIGYRGYTIEDIVEEGKGAISLSPSNITEEGNLSFGKSTFISWEKYEESPEIMLRDGFTVLVKTGSSYGKAALVRNLPEKTTINPQIVVLKPTRVDTVFLFLLVSNSSIQKRIGETVVGGAIPTLSQESIAQFDILIPSEGEQQKIAAILSSLDDLISAQTQKIEALKRHKRGLMQGLFPSLIDNSE